MEKSYKEIFSENLKAIMKDNEVNKKEVSLAIGCSDSVVSKWILMRSEPTLSNICKLCKFLNCQPNDLLEE